ncbi:stage V sporulation protein AD [Dehalobacter sp. DCM]|uniref:stage V sporulation protein AD n=1 Tax=Dehalobacter sp. DCM TaxID=2907827 RepID=UPI003081A5C1|nr:stage V sporulation protein AD [Dehalobacter sp. DCM]
MSIKRRGNQTVVFQNPPVILAGYNVVGPKEGLGPLKDSFDMILADTYNGEKSWEKTEMKMLEMTMTKVAEKAKVPLESIDYNLAGDLLNQIISSNYAARQVGLPFIGLYGACSTMGLSTALGAMLIDGGFASKVLCSASSHHDTAERQYRLPTEQGSQRPMSAQWTVTGAGTILLADSGTGPKVTSATIGRILDYGETDANNMGAAMAPAVADTILNHCHDLQRTPDYYDLIISGDLGMIGLQLLLEVLKRSGLKLTNNVTDCGVLIYDTKQDVHAGGSGCGCSAVVLTGHILKKLQTKEINKVLLIGSGSLHSTVATQQGESIPAIGHAVAIEN